MAKIEKTGRGADRGRVGRNPTFEDTFLWRICVALDESPVYLAKQIGVSYKQLQKLVRQDRGEISDIDRSEIWDAIQARVNRKLGLLMAARLELNKALNAQRTQRVSRIARAQKLTKKSIDRSS